MRKSVSGCVSLLASPGGPSEVTPSVQLASCSLVFESCKPSVPSVIGLSKGGLWVTDTCNLQRPSPAGPEHSPSGGWHIPLGCPGAPSPPLEHRRGGACTNSQHAVPPFPGVQAPVMTKPPEALDTTRPAVLPPWRSGGCGETGESPVSVLRCRAQQKRQPGGTQVYLTSILFPGRQDPRFIVIPFNPFGSWVNPSW